MKEKISDGPSKKFVSWDDLASKMFSKSVSDELNSLPLQEAKMWPMRWAIIIVAALLLILLIVYSTILFLVTKNPLTLIVPTSFTASIFVIIRHASRFLFWEENDYRLAEKALELKTKKLEIKHAHKSPRKAAE